MLHVYGFQTWSLTFRGKYGLRLSENKIQGRIFRTKRDENGSREGSTMRNFLVCSVHLI